MQTDVFAHNPVLRGYWYAVAQSLDVAPGPLAVTVLGEPLVLWRTADGVLTAARDRCPHREAPLSLGQVVESGLQCPYHGWTFGASGACVRIPSAPPERAIPPTARLTTIHATERYGLAWVSLDAPGADIPAMAYDGDARFRRINTPMTSQCLLTRWSPLTVVSAWKIKPCLSAYPACCHSTLLPQPVCRLTTLLWHGAASSSLCSRGQYSPGPAQSVAEKCDARPSFPGACLRRLDIPRASAGYFLSLCPHCPHTTSHESLIYA